jgi:hypothetical protein
MRRLTLQRRPYRGRRRGIALADAIIGGIILGLGLSVVLTVASRSLAMHTDGEKRLVASWLADELLTMVLVEGPDNYAMLYDTSGSFAPPFEEFSYEVDIETPDRGMPYRVRAVVQWGRRARDAVAVDTLIARRLGDPEQLREPYEPVDREARYYEEEFGE